MAMPDLILLHGLPKMKRGKRLFFMYSAPGKRPVSKPRGQIDKLRKQADRGKGVLDYVYAYTADEARDSVRKGKATRAAGRGGLRLSYLGGDIRSCAVWQEVCTGEGMPVLKCLKFAPACSPKPKPVEPFPKKKQGAVCIKTQKVPSAHYGRDVTRCKKYAQSTTAGSCLPFTPEKPERGLMCETEVTEKMIRDVARGMAEEMNVLESETGPWLAREITSRGGIAPYRHGFMKEEYRSIPLHLKNKKGLPLDEMADELNYETDQALWQEIVKAYPKGKKIKRKYDWQDFEGQAWEMLRKGMSGTEKWIQKAGLQKGAFTRKAKARGLGVQEFADRVIRNKNRYDMRTYKQALLARTFSKMSRGEYAGFGAEQMMLPGTPAYYEQMRLWEATGKPKAKAKGKQAETEIIIEHRAGQWRVSVTDPEVSDKLQYRQSTRVGSAAHDHAQWMQREYKRSTGRTAKIVWRHTMDAQGNVVPVAEKRSKS